VDPLLEAALRGELNEAQARQLSQRAPEAVTLALLALARRIAELQPRDGRSITPATPSDMMRLPEHLFRVAEDRAAAFSISRFQPRILPVDRTQWMSMLPHRPPFLFVDDVIEIGEDSITTVYHAAPDLPFFSGHFPGVPVMPGVLLCECCLQSGAIWVGHRSSEPFKPGDGRAVPVVTRIVEAKFKRVVRPGETLTIRVTLDEELGGAYFMTGKVSVEGETALRCGFAVTTTRP
jgi:3-hydroxyacyl-[acyl-carrier-protein] dehydratase